MRVLIATVAERAHLFGMVPVGWALRTGGHEVRVASQPALADDIAETGLTAVPVGKNHSFWRVARTNSAMDHLAEEAPLFGRAGRPPEEITWEYVKEGYRRVVPWWWRMFNDSMIADLTAFCREWRPDLVIWGPVTFAGAVAAKACGAAHARLLWGADKFALMRAHFVRLMAEQPLEEREDVMADWLGSHMVRYGGAFSEDMTHGQFTIDCLPDSLRLDTGLDYLSMRYVPYNGPSVVPSWLRAPPERPRVCVTLGLSATARQREVLGSARELLEALGDLDIEVVATLPGGERERIGRAPGNTRLVEFVPLNILMPTCSTIVHHSGWGTICTALAYGTPQVLLPNLIDQPLLARRVAGRKAGLVIPRGEVSGESVRDGVMRVLRDPAYQHGSAHLRREIAAAPSPNDLVPELERRTAECRQSALP